MIRQSFCLIPSRAVIFVLVSLCNVSICVGGNTSVEQMRKIADGFIFNMESNGYDVREGSTRYGYPLDDCIDSVKLGMVCHFPNPETKYNMPVFPYLEGEYVDEELVAPQLEMRRIRGDEALVLMTKTPPESAYFGYTHYVGFRQNQTDDGFEKVEVDGTLSDTLNPWNIKVERSEGTYEEGFEKDVIIVTTPHRDVYDAVKSALIEEGVSADIINLQAIPRSLFKWGLGEESDTLYFLNRVLKMKDETKADAYFDSSSSVALRVTPKVEMDVTDPYPLPIRMEPFMNTNEKYLEETFDAMELSILETYSSYFSLSSKFMRDPKIDQNECTISKMGSCYGLSDDTTYFIASINRTLTDDSFYLVAGVNHGHSNTKSRASTVTCYSGITQGPVATFDNEYMVGTANSFLDDSYEHRDSLYAVMMRRNCDGYDNCLEIPGGLYGLSKVDIPILFWRDILHHLPGIVATPHENIVYPRLYYFNPTSDVSIS